MQKTAYVSVISDFTLPTLEACVSFQPAQIMLIASDGFLEQAQRLKNLLDQKLHEAGSCTRILSRESTGDALGGDDLCANAVWLERHLLPLLQEYERHELHTVANITGGTKAMTLALSNCHRWQRLDYQAINKPLQSTGVQPDAQGSRRYQPFNTANANPWYEAVPMDIALLHNGQASEEPRNPLRQNSSSLTLAQSIWQAQQDKNKALALLFSGFERIWAYEREKHQQPSITLDWASFFPANTTPIDSGTLHVVQRWMQALQSVQAQGDLALLHANDEGITLPGNKAKKMGKHLQKWISGDWLEQLAEDWLVQSGVPKSAIACNVSGSPDEGKNSNSLREVDLLIHYQHKTSLIEVKAGLPPGKAPGELENQLSSIGSRFGKNRKALMLGPHLLHTLLRSKKADAFWFRCQANAVTLLLNKQHLTDFVEGRNPWRGKGIDGAPDEFRSGL